MFEGERPVTGSPLPRSTPEEHGVAPAAIAAFVDRLLSIGSELHGLVVVRHDHVIAEAWWEPYRAERVHLLYSISKPFTSTAVGFAVDEGALRLDDLVVDLMPDKLPDDVDANLAALRVRHLLSMSAGHAEDSTLGLAASEDWERYFLAQPFAHEPGTEFLYDTGATYLLSALVQRATGSTLLDYLRPRLFDPLGIGRVESHLSPSGVATGGWGMSVTTEAIAKLGLLYLRDGIWDGRRLLSAEWVRDATRAHTLQPSGSMTDDWQQGYGFQFWRCRHGAFRADGAHGQFGVVLPVQDAVVAITSRTGDLQGVLDAVWEILLPAFGPAPLPASTAPAVPVSPALPGPAGAPTSPIAARLDGAEYALESNDLGIATLRLSFDGDAGTIEFGDERIVAGFTGWIEGATRLPHTPPEGIEAFRRLHPPGPRPIAARAAWSDPATLVVRIQYVETPHHDTVTLRLDGDSVEVGFLSSITEEILAIHPVLPPGHEDPRPVLRGRRAGGRSA